MRPRPVGDLTWARASQESVYGKIESDWKLADGQFHWRVVVPPNTTATTYVPTTPPKQVRESGQSIDLVEGIDVVESQETAVVVKLGSGTYEFTAPFQK